MISLFQPHLAKQIPFIKYQGSFNVKLEQHVDVLRDVLDVPIRVPAIHQLLGTPKGPLVVKPAVDAYGNCAAWEKQ